MSVLRPLRSPEFDPSQCFRCGGSGVILYQPEHSSEVFEEECACPDPSKPMHPPCGPIKDPWQTMDETAKKWEAAGRGKWDIRNQGEDR